MELIIYFVRHGEVANPKEVLYGRLPGFGLSQNGIEQVSDTAKILVKHKIQHVYTSPLLRARQTSAIIGKAVHCTPIVRWSLIESKWAREGMPLKEFREKIEEKMYSGEYQRNGQESVKSQEKRMLAFIEKVTRKHLAGKIVAVSHGDPIMILRAKLENVPFTYDYKKKYYIPTGKYITVQASNHQLRLIK